LFSIQLPAEIENRLNALAQTTGRTKFFHVREALLEYLDDLEDLHLAEQRLLNIQAGRSQLHSLDDVERELDLAD